MPNVTYYYLFGGDTTDIVVLPKYLGQSWGTVKGLPKPMLFEIKLEIFNIKENYLIYLKIEFY